MKKPNENNFALVYRNPKELKKHIYNVELYGDAPDKDYVEHIRVEGVQDPLHILADDTVVGGHRRRQAAIIAGITSVPCYLRTDVDPADDLGVKALLLMLNKTRDKSNELKAREYQEWEKIETAKAEGRRKSGKSGAAGEAAEIAAKRVGLSKHTAKKASRVVEEMDRLKKEGKAKEAEALKEVLNKNVSEAARAVEKTQTTPFDEVLGGAEWVLTRVVPRTREFSLDIARLLGKNRGAFNVERIAASCKIIHDQFDAVKKILDHCQKKYRKENA